MSYESYDDSYPSQWEEYVDRKWDEKEELLQDVYGDKLMKQMGELLSEDYTACGDWIDDLDDGDIYVLMGEIEKFDKWVYEQEGKNQG